MGKRTVFIVGLIIFAISITANIFLITANSKVNKAVEVLLVSLDDKTTSIFAYKEYIKNHLMFYDLPISLIKKELSEQLSVNSFYDNDLAVIIPNGVCQSCLTTLLFDLSQNRDDKSNLFFVLANENGVTKRELIANDFKNIVIGDLTLFKQFDFKQKIIISKLFTTSNNYKYLIYEPKINEWLSDFF